MKRYRHSLAAAALAACAALSTQGLPTAFAQKAGPADEAPRSVREVFARNRIKIIAVEAAPAGKTQKCYTFRVELPYDPQSSQTAAYYNRLYPALLDALGGAAYTLIDVTDAVQIDVHLDHARNKMSVETSNLK